ncbi:hypothetical protein HK102_009766, partial [Quaeritorhiza haematococci]
MPKLPVADEIQQCRPGEWTLIGASFVIRAMRSSDGHPGKVEGAMDVPAQTNRESVVVACPDARPPAYQAVVGLHRSGMLRRFMTSYYHDPDSLGANLARKLAPAAYDRFRRVLARRHDDEIPADRVASTPAVDLSLRVESRLSG